MFTHPALTFHSSTCFSLYGSVLGWKTSLLEKTKISNVSHKRLFHPLMAAFLWYPVPSILPIFPPITNLRILISLQCSWGPHFLLLNCLALWPGHNNQGLPSDPKRHFSTFILMRYDLIFHYYCIIQHRDYADECAGIPSIPCWRKTGFPLIDNRHFIFLNAVIAHCALKTFKYFH